MHVFVNRYLKNKNQSFVADNTKERHVFIINYIC